LLAPGVAFDDLVVVGSRLAPRTVITSPVPIDNIRAAEMIATGQLTFDRMLTYTVPSFNATQQTISDATAHFDPADLRGLGPSRTLVLINGKRKSYSALAYINDTPGKGEVGVDMKSIPAAAIERVEVLRDGASAQYGSDAIAGVINVVLKDDIDVTNVNVFSGATTEGDGFVIGYDVNTGFPLGERGYINVTHSFSDQDETNRAGEPGRDDLFGVDASDPWIQSNPDLGMHVGQPQMTTGDVFYNGALPLTNGVELYSFGGLTFRKGLSYALYRTPYWIPDPFFIYHDPGTGYDGFQPTFETNILDNTVAVGFRGLVGGWNFDLSNIQGSNEVDYSVNNSLNVDLGAQSPTSFNTGGYEFRNNVTNLDATRRFGQFALAFGSEFRTENFVANAGEEASYEGSGAQSFPGLQPQNEVDEARYNIGVYGDVGVDVNEDFFLGGALRFENYSDFGDNVSWKINGRYKFAEDRATIRASASTGFRAPALHQIYLSIIQTLISGGTVSNQGTFNNKSPVLRALEVPQLEDENSFNLTAGVAFRPIDGLYISADLYQVDVDDRIVYSSSIFSNDPTTVVNQIQEQFSITSLKFFTNAVNTQTRGIDFVANYEFDLGGGEMVVNFSANVNDTEIEGQIATPDPIADANVDLFDRKEQSRLLSARPSDKVLLGFTYRQGPITAVLSNTRFGPVAWQHATDPTKDQTFDARIVTDLNLEYRISNNVGIGVAVNNLLNVYPEALDPKGDVVTDLGGRFRYPWEVNQFGFNGTTLTGNLNVRF
jgi:iron complex outermembrane receptor protein